jgi:hypothetical protein
MATRRRNTAANAALVQLPSGIAEAQKSSPALPADHPGVAQSAPLIYSS